MCIYMRGPHHLFGASISLSYVHPPPSPPPSGYPKKNTNTNTPLTPAPPPKKNKKTKNNTNIQDLDAGVIVGQDRTYGKGLVQNVEPLPYQTALKYTVAKYYTPSGGWRGGWRGMVWVGVSGRGWVGGGGWCGWVDGILSFCVENAHPSLPPSSSVLLQGAASNAYGTPPRTPPPPPPPSTPLPPPTPPMPMRGGRRGRGRGERRESPVASSARARGASPSCGALWLGRACVC